MKVLAIDPGSDRIGIAVMEKKDGKEIVLFSQCFETDKKADLAKRLYALGETIEQVLAVHKPSALGIETLFFNTNQKTALGVAQARGIIIFLAQKAGCRIYEFGPQEIKVAVTGYGKSDKIAVIDMVKKLAVGVPNKALDRSEERRVGKECVP